VELRELEPLTLTLPGGEGVHVSPSVRGGPSEFVSAGQTDVRSPVNLFGPPWTPEFGHQPDTALSHLIETRDHRCIGKPIVSAGRVSATVGGGARDAVVSEESGDATSSASSRPHRVRHSWRRLARPGVRNRPGEDWSPNVESEVANVC
jgi:hypothetical protein